MRPLKYIPILFLFGLNNILGQDLRLLDNSQYAELNDIGIKLDKVDFQSTQSIMFIDKPNHLSRDETSRESILPLMINSGFQEKKSPVFRSTLIGAGVGCLAGVIFGLMLGEEESWEYPIFGEPHKVQISTGENVKGAAVLGLGLGAGFGYLIGIKEEREMHSSN